MTVYNSNYFNQEQMAVYWEMRGEQPVRKHEENNPEKRNIKIFERNVLTTSLTPNAMQLNWKTPTKFPQCPPTTSTTPLEDYAENLKCGNIISSNQYGSHIIDEWIIYNKMLLVRTHTYNNIKNFSLLTITASDNKFVHESRTFFEEIVAKNALYEIQGMNDRIIPNIDSYC